MKKYSPAQLLNMLAMPALTVILGLILLLSPDSAAALVGKVLAWVTILAAVALGAGSVFGSAVNRNKHTIAAVICGAVGLWMLMNPLFLTKIIGRVLGLYLLLRGFQDGRTHLQLGGGKIAFTPGMVFSGVTAMIGLVLILVPLATSRVLFSVIGIVMICVGLAEGIDRLKGPKLLDEGQDPNIIDVEKL